MQYRDVADFFPELATLSERDRERLFEQARYDTFTAGEASTRWVWGLVSTPAVFALASVAFVLAYMAIGERGIWGVPVVAGVTALVSVRLQRRRYARLLRPALERLLRAPSDLESESGMARIRS